VRLDVDASTRTSNVERSSEDNPALRELVRRSVGPGLQGFLFFGTANSIVQRYVNGWRASVRRRFASSCSTSLRRRDGRVVSVGFVKLRQCARRSMRPRADRLAGALARPARRRLAANLRIHEFATLDTGLDGLRTGCSRQIRHVLPIGRESFHAMLAPHFTSHALDALTARLEVRDVDMGQPCFFMATG